MAGQNSGPKRYDFLEGLSMNELEELLRKSAELGQDDEDAFIDAVAEVIKRREKEDPTGRLPDTDEAWREFQTHFNTPEGRGLSLYPDEEDDEIGQAAPPKPKKKRKVFTLRRFAVAAVIAALYFATILPTALGYENVFIMVGSWNDTLFHFVFPGQDPNPADTPTDEEYESLQDALERNGVNDQIAPKIPEAFELIMVEVIKYPEYGRIDYNAFYQVGQTDEQNMSIYIIQQDKPISTRSYEKDGTLVEIYPVNGIEHYIYENNGRVSVTWYTDVFECSLRGHITVDEARSMIDSIYER